MEKRRMIFEDVDGTQYEIAGTGDGGTITPGVPIPSDTVDTEAIVDGAVQMEDLNDSVKDVMITGNDRVTSEDLEQFEV